MRNQARLDTFQRPDYTFESRGNVCEVGNTTSNDKDLAVWTGRWARDQVNWQEKDADSEYMLYAATVDSRIVFAYSYVWPSDGAPLYSP